MAQQMAAEWDLPEANLSFEGDNEAFVYNRHNESIYDDVRYFPGLKHDQETVVKFDASNDDFINHATLRALIVQLTSPEVIDYNLICDFFLTYRTFTDSHTVMNLLLTRLIWSLQYVNSFKQDTEKIGKLVLLRTFVVLRHWILNYFIDDFLPDDKLCDTFSFYINQITHESHLIRANMVLN
ncbi:CIC11C00000003710 [Sungouiella intermedia]|uniref:CIC11C00000003710 n=1 Tax=Sungouiella intermedia TaxID=45354 RepID=A0A1L0B9V5_9ASCO|nr:CIC11C00000003710 [[Candida] intermedia]